jgi:TPM domain
LLQVLILFRKRGNDVIRLPWQKLVLGVAAVLGLASVSAAAEVIDNAKLFKPETVAAAKETLTAVEAKSGGLNVIETFATPPAELATQLEKVAGPARRDLFVKWAKERQAETKSTGLYVLISNEPRHLEVGVGESLRNHKYSNAERDQVVKSMLTEFRSGEFDKGLGSAVDVYQKQLNSDRSTVAAPVAGSAAAKSIASGEVKPNGLKQGEVQPGTANKVQDPFKEIGMGDNWWMWIVGAVVVFIGFSILMGILRNLFGGGAAGSPGMGGGGFANGLMGGLLGAVAGNWLYDSFSHGSGHSNQAFGGDGSGADSGMGSDTSSGFGDSGGFGGGDFGGGDFGGGDFGGGDF